MKRLLSLALAIAMTLLCAGQAFALTASSFEKAVGPVDYTRLQSIADKYNLDFELLDAKRADGLTIVAEYDDFDQFEEALSKNYAERIMPQSTMEAQSFTGAGVVQTSSTNLNGTSNRKLADVSLGLDLMARIKYTYFNNASNKRVYTGINSFETYFSGLNLGYSFQLLGWTGTPISKFWWEGNQPYYTSASQSTQYYYGWDGMLTYTVNVFGNPISVSEYIWSYSYGTML